MIHDIIKDHKRVDNAIKKIKNLGLWHLVVNGIDQNSLLSDSDSEKLWVFINGVFPQCPFKNPIKFINYSVGYKRCGPARSCECTRRAVSEAVSKTKLLYDDQTKKQINEKRSKTNIERYGIDNVFRDVDKMREYYIAHFGVSNPNKLKAVRDKIKNTCISKFGGVAPGCDPAVQARAKQTILSKYGVEHSMLIPGAIEKQHQTMMARYGVPYPIQNPDLKEKVKQTCLQKYGFDNPSKSPIIIEKIKNSQRKIFLKKLESRLSHHNIKPVFRESEFNFIYNQQIWSCTVCDTEFTASAVNGHVPRCPKCYPQYISSGQIDVMNYVASLIGQHEISVNNRQLILSTNSDNRRNREIDLYIPSHNLAIEYCGLRWHTENYGRKDKFYHYDKWFRCQQMGIRLLTVFSDDWYMNKDIVKSIISVGLGQGQKIHARNTHISVIKTNQTREFFNDNHISGYANSSINLGLILDNQLVMCMSFAKSRFNKNFQYEIVRMASIKNTVVVGGASKLFDFFVKNFNPTSVISYCDLKFGSGKVYEKLGFIPYQKPTIGYQYVDINHPWRRYDRRHFQKHKLKIDESSTETEYMNGAGYDKIWDCGHQKFIYKLV